MDSNAPPTSPSRKDNVPKFMLEKSCGLIYNEHNRLSSVLPEVQETGTSNAMRDGMRQTTPRDFLLLLG
jgi:hypothetical protein